MTAIVDAKKHRLRRDRLFWPGERALLVAACRSQPRHALQWRQLVRLTLETGASLRESLSATWDDIDLRQRSWAVEREGFRRNISLSRRAVRILRILKIAAGTNPGASDRLFHPLTNVLSMSKRFGFMARRAGVPNYCFSDLQYQAFFDLAKRGFLAPAEVAFALGMEPQRSVRMWRAFVRK